jgi:hypothetical protein
METISGRYSKDPEDPISAVSAYPNSFSKAYPQIHPLLGQG